jgi:hypothetical protein
MQIIPRRTEHYKNYLLFQQKEEGLGGGGFLPWMFCLNLFFCLKFFPLLEKSLETAYMEMKFFQNKLRCNRTFQFPYPSGDGQK